MTTDNGQPEDSAAPEAPAPEAPVDENAERLTRIEKALETLATRGSGSTPPTAETDEAAVRLQQEIAEQAKTDPGLQHSLTIGQGLYNHFQRELGMLRADLEIARIEDPEERRLTEEAVQSGEFKSVAAARRAVKGDLASRPAPTPLKPDPETQRKEVEKVRNTDTNVRGVSAPDFKKRMTDKDYATKVGDTNLSMDDRVKLRREHAATK